MSAAWKEGNGMKELTISVRTAEEKPKEPKTTAELLERCRAFYRDEENERAFQEWKSVQRKKEV